MPKHDLEMKISMLGKLKDLFMPSPDKDDKDKMIQGELPQVGRDGKIIPPTPPAPASPEEKQERLRRILRK